jgi:hypothetical protein
MASTGVVPPPLEVADLRWEDVSVPVGVRSDIASPEARLIAAVLGQALRDIDGKGRSANVDRDPGEDWLDASADGLAVSAYRWLMGSRYAAAYMIAIGLDPKPTRTCVAAQYGREMAYREARVRYQRAVEDEMPESVKADRTRRMEELSKIRAEARAARTRLQRQRRARNEH